MRRRRSWVVVWAALASTACEVGAGAGEKVACFSIQDCGTGQVCFFGRCVDSGFELATVYTEVTPPNDSAYLVQQIPDPLHLGEFQDLTLLDTVVFTGSVVAPDPPIPEDDSLTGTLVAKSREPGIPGRDLVRQATVTSSGFSLRALAGWHDLSFETRDGALPPIDYPGVDIDAGLPPRPLAYPEIASLVQVKGRALFTGNIESRIPNAMVTGVGRGLTGAETRSSTAETDESTGAFTLLFLPGAREFDVTVGPGGNPYVPEATFCDLSVVTPSEGVGDLVLGVPDPQKISVNAKVVNEQGFGVGDASVLFEGYAVGTQQGRFVASATSGPNGELSSFVMPGDYLVTVAPPRAQPYALSTQTATIATEGSSVTITVRAKVPVTGIVRDAEGNPVAGAEISLSRRDSPLSRVFSTESASDGSYHLVVDPGAKDESGALVPAEYELTVNPGVETGLPLYRALVLVEGSELVRDIDLYEPRLVYGIVRDPKGAPLSGAILAFYSLEFADDPVLVGLVVTLDGARAGEFVLPVPLLPATP